MNLRANASWMFVANVIYSFCQWLFVIVLAKLGTAGLVGSYSLGLAVVAPVIGFAMSNLRAMQATDVRNEYSFSEYHSFRIGSIICACALLSVYVLVDDIPSPDSRWAIFLLGLVRGLEAIADVIYGEAQRKEQLKTIALSMILRSALQIIAFIVVFLATRALMPAILASVCITALTLACYDYPSMLHRRHTAQPLWQIGDLARIKKLALSAAPFGVIVTINLLAMNIPRYFLANQMGETALGYFSSISYFIVAGSVIVNAVGQSAAPRLARYFLDNRLAFTKLTYKLYAFGLATAVLGILVAWIAGGWVLRLFYTADYVQYSRELIYVMIAAGLLYLSVLQGSSLTAARCIMPQVGVNIVMLLVLAISCYLLISPYGLIGAAWAMCLGNATKLIGQSLLNFLYI